MGLETGLSFHGGVPWPYTRCTILPLLLMKYLHFHDACDTAQLPVLRTDTRQHPFRECASGALLLLAVTHTAVACESVLSTTMVACIMMATFITFMAFGAASTAFIAAFVAFTAASIAILAAFVRHCVFAGSIDSARNSAWSAADPLFLNPYSLIPIP